MKRILMFILLSPLCAVGQIAQLSCSSSSITGAASDTCVVTLSSPAGSQGLTVSLTSGNSAVTIPSHLWAAPKATSVTFTANANAVPQPQTALLTAFYNSGGIKSPQTFTLNLYPTPTSGSSLVVTPVSLLFGNVTLNTPSTMTVTLKNTGNALITGTAAVTGTGFSITPPQIRLYAGRTMTLPVQFDPAATGSFRGSVTIQTNAENPSLVVPLSGTGAGAVQHSVTLSWAAPGSSAEPISGYIAYRSLNGGNYSALFSSPVSSTTYVDTAVQSGAAYSYYIESVGQNGQSSGPSTTVQATVP
jgi:hypothetical protein